jgi:hypothetical protein
MRKQYYRFVLFAILVAIISSVLAADTGSDFIAASGDSVPRWDYGMIEQLVIVASAFAAGFIGYLLSGFGWALFAFIIFTFAQGYGINSPEIVTSTEWRDLSMAVITLLVVTPFVTEGLIKGTKAVKRWWKKEFGPSTPARTIEGGLQDT